MSEIYLSLLIMVGVGLGCLGLLAGAALTAGLFDEKYHGHSRDGFRWGISAAMPVAGVLIAIGKRRTATVPGPEEFAVIVGILSLAGFAVGVLLWYVFRLRLILRRGRVPPPQITQ